MAIEGSIADGGYRFGVILIADAGSSVCCPLRLPNWQGFPPTVPPFSSQDNLLHNETFLSLNSGGNEDEMSEVSCFLVHRTPRF